MHGHVELHGHRGARGLRPENTLPGLAFALELGVDALEFDVALSSDGQIVLTHDLIVSPVTSADTGMATAGDEMFPYVGKPIGSLSLAQLRTLDVGIRLPTRPDDPFALTQVPLPDTRMPTLGAVLGLVDAYGADGVRLHVELKSDPDHPELTADPREFTELVVKELDRHGRLANAALLSFDWRVLEAARPLVDRRYALVEEATMAPAWMNGLDLADFGGDLAAAARAVGATTLSPDRVLVDQALMTAASECGLPVVVWTVNDPDEAAALLDLGVAGIVTDYPDRMRLLWAARGLPLPRPIAPLRNAVA
ncbi:glycerophosphodiester phosphodiesterase family protein [Microtetraspora sp. NBRC 16547]|uniref:glycerophosphodiester phosphodiesterase family protein n=1 Tax=Microtetraspora sp. NBRC 16547 TaxID=3030993 RepID=UPI0024A4D736|nr:glycerophosphodiester phosphodiesterase family protein [Microtetraspora sp. NBRC 16547]GLX00333.1 putative glycerophosphoryl diester phosphodiesterase precursor [Microtetraspora sp. NBRC 16547]